MSAVKHVLKPEFKILFSLEKLGGKASFKELIAETGLYPSTFYMNIKELIARGLVAKQGTFYVLTPQGRDVVKEVKKELAEVVA